jgi:hypothetical protein
VLAAPAVCRFAARARARRLDAHGAARDAVTDWGALIGVVFASIGGGTRALQGQCLAAGVAGQLMYWPASAQVIEIGLI